MDTVADLQQDPIGRGSCDAVIDRYTADFVSEAAAGLIVYVVAQAQRRVIILRVAVLL